MMNPVAPLIKADNILFNALKHHRGFIRRQLMDVTPHTLPERLKVLGNSQMDIYYGVLDLPDVFHEVTGQLNATGLSDEAGYLQRLKASGGYIEITLSDTSRWILLHGIEPGRYVHLHPARYSPHSIRVKATVLKTALACMAILPAGTQPDLQVLNHIRQSVLDLSPVKELEQCEHLWKVMKMLQGE
ncbi:hypothetical protein [Chitinophaga pinensis]|uniref:Uncharacterized protein n=1 Tax=Chitinophaga pinensis TaxID=79329 RepID=A0A5C6LMP9_9BACT|nr:hypothetical protein [Chitinophaga pinensis]TWV96278.1 hypothetical protein FEF09_23180 [Chitinophaga pinensis]